MAREDVLRATPIDVANYMAGPGRLPNTVTVEEIKTGVHYARNQTLVNIMRDYGYVEAYGMGISKKMILGMQGRPTTGLSLNLLRDGTGSQYGYGREVTVRTEPRRG